MKQAIIYTRFSPRPHAGDCMSCEFQEEKARAYCDYREWDVLAVHQDKACSGKRADKKSRPGLNLALQEALRGRHVLVCYNMARLSRSIKDLCEISDKLARRGADLVLVTEQIDTKTPMGRFFFHVMGAIGQWQRESTGEITREVLLSMQARGLRVSSKPPYGYMIAPYDEKLIIEHPTEQQYLRLMRTLRQQGMTARGIETELIRREVPARGIRWYAGSIARMMDRFPE